MRKPKCKSRYLAVLLSLFIILTMLAGCSGSAEPPVEEAVLNSVSIQEQENAADSMGEQTTIQSNENGAASENAQDSKASSDSAASPDPEASPDSDTSELEQESTGQDQSEASSSDASAGASEETEAPGLYVSPTRYEDFNADTIPAFAGNTYAVIHDNVPYFTEDEIAQAKKGAYEDYSPLDNLGRCGRAMGSIGVELMPSGSRGDIYWIHPSGWQKSSGYERSHLIAFQLAGENDNEQNLVTGTHFFNNDGMRPFEELVGDYVRESQSLVLYRVTPVFQGDELVCRGALMEAISLEDDGEDILFCVFIYNVFDPSEHTLIDYKSGRTYEGELEIAQEGMSGGISQSEQESGEVYTYIVNTRSGIFHYPDCEGVEKMSERNKQEFTGTREDALDAGYWPCPHCNP
ncbi:MAG: DNA/RNA non-specific endonuclease [Firmicutes bacterium]|nr:DNA/RNA non-specific endonuclease [Bacillota bacterium]